MPGEIDNTTILAAANQIIKAINDLRTSVNAGNQIKTVTAGCGCSVPPDTIVDPPGAPGLGNPATDPPPAGFDSWFEYNANKCRAANRIVDDLISTCNNLTSIPGVVSGLSAGLLYLVIQAAFFASGEAAIASGLIALGLASATGVAIVITALVTIIVAGIGGLAYFASLASALTSIKATLVCDLYAAQSVEEARVSFYSDIDDAIAGLESITEFLSDQINKIVQALVGTAVLNTLFEPNELVAEYVGTVDCATCEACDPDYIFTESTSGFSGSQDDAITAGSGSGSTEYADNKLKINLSVPAGIGNAGAAIWSIDLTPNDLSISVEVDIEILSTTIPAQAAGVYPRFYYDDFDPTGYETSEVDLLYQSDGMKTFTFSGQHAGVNKVDIGCFNGDLGGSIDVSIGISRIKICHVPAP